MITRFISFFIKKFDILFVFFIRYFTENNRPFSKKEEMGVTVYYAMYYQIKIIYYIYKMKTYTFCNKGVSFSSKIGKRGSRVENSIKFKIPGVSSNAYLSDGDVISRTS